MSMTENVCMTVHEKLWAQKDNFTNEFACVSKLTSAIFLREILCKKMTSLYKYIYNFVRHIDISETIVTRFLSLKYSLLYR